LSWSAARIAPNVEPMSDAAPPYIEPRSREANWIRQMTAANVLRKVLLVFESAGIAVLPVKGIVTSHVLYDDYASRTLGDVDVRIPRRHFQRAVRLARTHGWNPNADSLVLWSATLEIDSFEVDIECTLGLPGLCRLTVEDLLARAERSVDPFGVNHLEPELNDHALILVINAFKDGLKPRPWALEDLRRIVLHSRFDPEKLVARARAGRVASALWIVAAWLADEHGVSEWRVVCDRVGAAPPSPRVARVYRYVRQHGWPQKAALVTGATSSDELARSAWGLSLAAAGVLRRRARVLGGAFHKEP
jgi:hypothetical protein